jgi:YVTN family beta-propeller protein
VRNRIVMLALVALAAAVPSARALGPFVEFETGQVRPLALSPDPGQTRLFAINTPDNRLEIFDVDGAGNLTPAGSVPVGMEPIAVAARTADEVWVVNHLSDSVSVVDVASSPPHVVRTLLVGDEPRDIVFAGPGGTRAFITTAHRGQNSGVPFSDFTTEGIGRADVWVFDATDLGSALGGMPITVIQLFGDTPRALATSPDGSTVYAAAFHSGNQTMTINEGLVCNGGSSVGACSTPGGEGAPGGLPPPGILNCASEIQPEVGLIVRRNPSNGHWEDELHRDWSALVKFNLPDDDVFVIDADATIPAESATPFRGVGTILFNMAVNPVSGTVYVSNTEARNEVRFEGPGGCSTTVQGHLHEARITVIDGTVKPRHLNKHIDYNVLPAPLSVKQKSLATPTGMVVTPDGQTLYVAAFGSAKVGVFDTAALENDTFVPDSNDHIPLSAGGPSGLVLRGDRLYVFTRFDNGISTINTTLQEEVAHTTLFNPEPANVVDGRPFLYDATSTSSNGEASCSSCHVFGDFDSLAWDLGNPDAGKTTSPIPARVSFFDDPDFYPMKGPMTTQSLRGLANHGAMHWRGDRSVGFFGTSAFDEELSFKNFIVAFQDLVGNDGLIPTADMQRFADFMLDVVYPPNPIRNLQNTDTPTLAAARTTYNETISDTKTCNECHALNPAQGFFGTDGFASFENETQRFKIAHLRNAYQKIGMFGFAQSPFVNGGDNGNKGDQVRGFGFLHDGSIDTVFRFLNASVFSLTDTERTNLQEFVLSFPTTLAPIVGQQITLTDTNAATVNARINLMIARAQTPFDLVGQPGARECDLIVKGTVGGVQRGWRMSSVSGAFLGDKATDPPLTDGQLRALATTPGQELTYTCAPPGSGIRMGIDRDLDGILDGDDGSISTTTTTTTIVSSTTTTTIVSSTTTTTIPAGCASVPASGCRLPGKTIVLAKTGSSPAKRKLVWKFLKGPATVATDFGAPTTTDDYELCLYGAGGTLLTGASAPAGGTCGNRDCWRDLGPRGYKYVDRDATPNGLQKLVLRAGDAGRSKVIAKGKGANLTLPALPIGGFPLTVQLQGEHGECWQGSFAAGDVRANTAGVFKAKAQMP